jgi:mRNA interferase MazF
LATKSGNSAVPDRSDIVWIDFAPTAGHEQSGRRPALVITPAFYNARSHMAVVCPITSKSKGYSFEVPLPDGLPVTGVVLSDHIRSVDWQSRGVQFITRLPDDQMQQVLDRIEALLLPETG